MLKSTVMTLANSLHYHKHLSRSQALKTAWRMVKQSEFYSKAVGVTYNNRQTALARLQRYSTDTILSLIHI